MPSKPTRRVRTFRALQSAIAEATPVSIQLGADIAIGQPITIPERHDVDANGYGFIKQGAGAIQFYGTLKTLQAQIFYGFSPGDVTGGMGVGAMRPVWWGVRSREFQPASDDPGGDEEGINCAIQSGSAAHGHTVELDDGYYSTSGPIVLAGYNTQLRGLGAHRTEIWTAQNWAADWKDDAFYGSASHGAMIWIGSQVRATAASMNTSVAGVALNAYNAAAANLTKRVSGISTFGWIEEHSILSNISVSYFSGYGIGVGSSGAFTSVVNGLHCENLWLTQPVSASALPLCAGYHSTNATFRGFTIDARVLQGSLFGGSSWPLTRIGVWAEGLHTIVEAGHIESVMHAVMVRDSVNQMNTVKVSGIDALWGVDTNYRNGSGIETPMVYTSPYPDTRVDAIAVNSNWYDWSTLLSIYGTPSGYSPESLISGGVHNHHTRVVAENLVGQTVKYLVRDPAMGVQLLSHNTNPISGYYGALTGYRRSTTHSPGNATDYFNVSGAYGNFSGLAAPKSAVSDYYQIMP